ncbi:MAG: hypothetical protein LBN38_03900 [Verrucomicrobiota bacterium]|nr:hypothetical protein [Verrucomicrobiota bacterium]
MKPYYIEEVLITPRQRMAGDIPDTGWTVAHLMAKGVRSVRTCVLPDKPSRRIAPYEANFAGARMEDAFVGGYGLDYDGRHRELPPIAKGTFSGAGAE